MLLGECFDCSKSQKIEQILLATWSRCWEALLKYSLDTVKLICFFKTLIFCSLHLLLTSLGIEPTVHGDSDAVDHEITTIQITMKKWQLMQWSFLVNGAILIIAAFICRLILAKKHNVVYFSKIRLNECFQSS